MKPKYLKKSQGRELQKIEIKDLSLYKNCMMVKDRIWVPKSLAKNFFNNLHLGHRGFDIMMRLAKRSVYWPGMSDELTGYYNECQHCYLYMQANKKPADLPEEESSYPFQKISMDLAETNLTKEHILVISDRTGCTNKPNRRRDISGGENQIRQWFSAHFPWNHECTGEIQYQNRYLQCIPSHGK